MVTQMLLGAALISGTVVIHAIGTLYAIGPLRWITSSLAGSKRRLDQLGFTILIVLWLFLLHSMEIWIWATFYWLMAEMPDFETALYFSTVTFTTLGYGDIVLDPDWRLVSAFQAANGILLFGWSTTYLLVAVRRIWEAELD